MSNTPTAEDGSIELDGASYFPVHLESLRRDITPDFDLYIRPGDQDTALLYCQQGATFDRALRLRLSQNKVENLYIRKDQQKVYQRHLAAQLPGILRDDGLSAERKSAILYDSAQAVMEEVLDGTLTRSGVKQGKEIVQHTVNFMTSSEFVLGHLLRKMTADYYLYTHSVNVVAYSVALAQRAGYQDKATLRELAHGALLHDVGEFRTNDELRKKTKPLNNEEWEKIHNHPREGIRLLSRVGTLGEIAMDVVLHHHEKLDGSGYPDGLKDLEISPWVRIVTIADIFDALTTERHHQKPRTSFEALKIMTNEMKEELDPDLFRHFVMMMTG